MENLSTDYKTVFLFMDLEPHENVTSQVVSVYNQLGLLQTATTSNTRQPNHISITEADPAVAIFTSGIKSAKNASEIYHEHPLRDAAIPDL